MAPVYEHSYPLMDFNKDPLFEYDDKKGFSYSVVDLCGIGSDNIKVSYSEKKKTITVVVRKTFGECDFLSLCREFMAPKYIKEQSLKWDYHPHDQNLILLLGEPKNEMPEYPEPCAPSPIDNEKTPHYHYLASFEQQPIFEMNEEHGTASLILNTGGIKPQDVHVELHEGKIKIRAGAKVGTSSLTLNREVNEPFELKQVEAKPMSGHPYLLKLTLI